MILCTKDLWTNRAYILRTKFTFLPIYPKSNVYMYIRSTFISFRDRSFARFWVCNRGNDRFLLGGFLKVGPRFQPVSYVTSNYDIPGEVSFVPRYELQRMPFYEDL